MKSRASLNHVYRLVWSERLRAFVAVAEIVRARGKRAGRTAGFVAMLCAVFGGSAMAAEPAATALPTGGQVTAGQANISQTGARMDVNQSSNRAIVQWNTFNIGRDAHVNFNQPSASSVTLNRVLDTNASNIFGRLTANGQVFLTNPQGVYFAPGAQVDVGALVATTHQINDSDFLNGHYRFARNGASGGVINDGRITAASGGYVALLAPEVRNEGVITARLGTVVLAGGEVFTLEFDLAGLTNVIVQPATIRTLVENRHMIVAEGGTVILATRAASELLAGVVNSSGIIEARGISQQGGRIILDAGEGQTTVSGALDVSSATGRGGRVVVTGERVLIDNGARLSATGGSGGGEIYVGGGWQGGDPSIRQATGTIVMAGATLDASATGNGDGGTVVAWSDIHRSSSVTRAYGTFLATGGPIGGNGGRIETSGHWLDTQGVKGSAAAPNGAAGQWLFDPYNVTITSANANGSFSAGTWTPSANSSTILNTDINTLLEGGTSVTVTTGTSGSQIGDIVVSSAITKSTGNTDVTLTLRAANSIDVQAALSNTGGTGKMHVVLDADNNGGTRDGGGIILLSNDITTGGGNIQFGTGATMSIGGVTTLVGGDVYVAGSGARTLTTGGGNVTVNGELILANTSGLTINTSNGNVTFGSLLNSGNSYTSVYNASAQTWSTVLVSAKGSTSGGDSVGDTYLATITSRLENAIASRTVGYQQSWLGGQRKTGISTDAVWRWVTGPEGLEDSGNGRQFFTQVSSGSGGTAINGSYTNWNSGEPNNCYGGTCNGSLNVAAETAVQFTGSTGVWNDLNQGSGATLNYYVRETNLATSPLTVNAGTGTVTFTGVVGGSKALSSLNVTAGTIAINGGAVTTTSAQTYTGAVTTGAATTLTASSITTTSTVSASSNALTLTTDSVSLGGNVSGTGTLTIQPKTASTTIGLGTETGTLSLNATELGYLQDGFSQITVGSSTAGAITVGSAITINDNITLVSNGNIVLDAAVNAAGQTVTLTGAGTVSGNGNITAASLLLNGAGSYTLNTASANNVGTLAATGVAALSYQDSDALSIGTVGSTNGISASGTVSVATSTGNLTVAQNVATTNTTSSAITLNAGKDTAAGTSTGGSIVISGSPTISTGSGGRATLYTGSVSGSTGLTSLLGSGSGRFRYNSDESATNYTTALGSGSYGIYREQPTATVTANNQTVTYGTSPTLTTSVSGLQNGDTSAQAIGTAATVAIGGSTSTAGAYTAGSHTLTASGAAGGLGYGFSYVDGTLTVNQKTLAVTYTGVNKTYDGGTTTTVTTGDDRVTSDVLTINRTAAFANKDVGNGKTVNVSGVSLSGTDAGNYTVATTGSTTANIAQAALTVTASDASQTYSGTAYSGGNGVSYSGFVGGETTSVLGGTLSYGGTSQGATNVGSYVITPAGLTSSNYAVTFVGGTLTITSAASTSSTTSTALPPLPPVPGSTTVADDGQTTTKRTANACHGLVPEPPPVIGSDTSCQSSTDGVGPGGQSPGR